MGIAVEHKGLPLTRASSMGPTIAATPVTATTPTTTTRSPVSNNANHQYSYECTIIGTSADHSNNNNKPQLRSEGSRSFHRAHSNPMVDRSSSNGSPSTSQQRQQQQQHLMDEETGTTTTNPRNSSNNNSQAQHYPYNTADDNSDAESHTSSTTHSYDGNDQQPFLTPDPPDDSSSGHNPVTNICGFVQVLKDDILDYLHLLRTNRAFRLFLCSYVFGHMGEWFTYIASISLMERMLNSPTGLDAVLGDDATTTSDTTSSGSEHSRTSIGILVMIRLLPTVLLSPFGGVLADSRDRRKSMIVLDLMGACTPILFILATFLETSSQIDNIYGVAMIYFATVCQECVCALYEPCRTSIVPLLVTGNDSDLKKATTLTGVAWSAVAAFGSAAGGFATSYFGARVCFCKYIAVEVVIVVGLGYVSCLDQVSLCIVLTLYSFPTP